MDFYYIDRPVVPATQQVSINISGVKEHGVTTTLAEMNGDFYANVVEVRDSDGIIVGSLLYVPGVTYEHLVAPTTSEDEAVTEEEPEGHSSFQVEFEFLGETFFADEDTAKVLEEIEACLECADDDDVTVYAQTLKDIGQQIVNLQKRNNRQYEMLTSIEQQRADGLAEENV